jgi:MOSC domain-containing protein YiiM
METIAALTARNAKAGMVQWIGIRPERRKQLIALDQVKVTPQGLEGDHYASGGKRAVTLIQYEHLSVIAAFLGIDCVSPLDLRRNIVVSGINLLGLRNRQLRIGDTILEGTGLCAPCSRMEETFGEGGYSAVRGHGGITAKIIQPGKIQIGDQIKAL